MHNIHLRLLRDLVETGLSRDASSSLVGYWVYYLTSDFPACSLDGGREGPHFDPREGEESLSSLAETS